MGAHFQLAFNGLHPLNHVGAGWLTNAQFFSTDTGYQSFAVLKHLKVIGIFPLMFQDVLKRSNPRGERLSLRPLNYSDFMKEETQYSKLQRGDRRKQGHAPKAATTCPALGPPGLASTAKTLCQKEFPSGLQISDSTAPQCC